MTTESEFVGTALKSAETAYLEADADAILSRYDTLDRSDDFGHVRRYSMASAQPFQSMTASVFPSQSAEIVIAKQPVLADYGREVRSAINQLPPDVSATCLSSTASRSRSSLLSWRKRSSPANWQSRTPHKRSISTSSGSRAPTLVVWTKWV